MAVGWALVGAFGAIIGSFLNVVIWRVPRGESVVRPASACPACGAPIRPWDNVPVISWLILGGRCRDCRARISLRYPTVELATALVFVAVVLRFHAEPTVAAVPAYLYLGAVGLALTLIDIDTHRLPNSLVLPSYGVLALLLTGASWATGDFGALLRAVVGGCALYAFYFLPNLIKPGAMGFGDVKLAGLLGAALAWIGWGSFAVGAFAAFLLGGGYAIALMVSRRARRGSRLPFGPWMVLGAAIGVGWGESLWADYLALLT